MTSVTSFRIVFVRRKIHKVLVRAFRYRCKRNGLILVPIFVLLSLFFTEAILRYHFMCRRGVPFFSPLIHFIYPEMAALEKRELSGQEASFDVLMLGPSVFHPEFGEIQTLLQNRLATMIKKDVRIHNVSQPAHTSLDSKTKYERLVDKTFDLVLLYHGINEVRANNCAPEVFRDDYSHYTFYSIAGKINKGREGYQLLSYYCLELLSNFLKEIFGLRGYVSSWRMDDDCLDYGKEIKTKRPFINNLNDIVSLAKEKEEPVVLMTFAYYIPSNYSSELFSTKSLDYGNHKSPIEVWGLPANVDSGIQIHNQVIRSISAAYPHVIFLDQNKLMPKSGRYFNDICHFTKQGSERFTDNIIEVIQGQQRFKELLVKNGATNGTHQ